MVINSNEGYLDRTGIYGTYSYTICSCGAPAFDKGSTPSSWFITGALQGGMVQRRINYGQLLFADQINSSGVIQGSISQADPPILANKWYPDFSAGFYFSHKLFENSNLLLGFSAHHINRPDESLLSTSDTFRSQLPVRWSGNIAYQFEDGNWSWGIAALYYQQAQQNTFQVGIDIKPVNHDFSLGVWAHFTSALDNPTGVTVTIKYSFNRDSNHKQSLKIGYAQDFPINNNSLSYTTGSSELGVIWDYNTKDESGGNKCKPRVNTSSCPLPVPSNCASEQ